MPIGNYLRKTRKNFYLSEDCRYFIECLSKYMGLSEGAVLEEAVRQLYMNRIGPYEWEVPEDPRPLQKRIRNIRKGA